MPPTETSAGQLSQKGQWDEPLRVVISFVSFQNVDGVKETFSKGFMK